MHSFNKNILVVANHLFGTSQMLGKTEQRSQAEDREDAGIF